MTRVEDFEKTHKVQNDTRKLPTLAQKLLSKYQECVLLTKNYLLQDLRDASRENTPILLRCNLS
jgi:hypothetical protein